MTLTILAGDCRDVLRTMPAESVQCCVTSPPYFGLRDYGVDGQMGLEPTPTEYVAGMVEVFREVRRVLRDDGTLWLNLGDSYAGSWGAQGHRVTEGDSPSWHGSQIKNHPKRARQTGTIREAGLKPKDLIGIPWLVAFALRADGWYLRQENIWAKPNPMPESVTDRCTKSHEHVFLMSKSERYFWDYDAMQEPVTASTVERLAQPTLPQQHGSDRVPGKTNGPMKAVGNGTMRNKRDVWTIATQPFAGAHFAVMPQELAKVCILAGSRPGDIVLDPFGGSGTTGIVADRHGRHSTLIELNPEYAQMMRDRLHAEAGIFAEVK